jgi:TolB-like protein
MLLWIAGLLGGSALAQQVDLHEALIRSSRVGVLPFANLSGVTSASGDVLSLVRIELTRKAADVADSATTAASLRKLRIRNASELSVDEARSLARDLDVRYLLIGSVERYQQLDSAAEVAVSARLLDVATGNIVWVSAATLKQNPSTRLLGLGSKGNVSRLARSAVNSLLKDFRYSRKPGSRVVTDLRLKRKKSEPLPCRKIALVTFGNETATNFAGNMVADQLYAALFRRGFELVDPGRVREVMVAGQDLMQGEISDTLLQKLRDDLGVDFVLTGTVSRFETNRSEFADAPVVAFEARLIDTATANLVWAKTVSREGADSAWILGIGYCHSLLELSNRLARVFAADIPVTRRKIEDGVK